MQVVLDAFTSENESHFDASFSINIGIVYVNKEPAAVATTIAVATITTASTTATTTTSNSCALVSNKSFIYIFYVDISSALMLCKIMYCYNVNFVIVL